MSLHIIAQPTATTALKKDDLTVIWLLPSETYQIEAGKERLTVTVLSPDRRSVFVNGTPATSIPVSSYPAGQACKLENKSDGIIVCVTRFSPANTDPEIPQLAVCFLPGGYSACWLRSRSERQTILYVTMAGSIRVHRDGMPNTLLTVNPGNILFIPAGDEWRLLVDGEPDDGVCLIGIICQPPVLFNGEWTADPDITSDLTLI